MKKELKVNLNVDLTSECWTFLRLSILMGYDEYIPWYIERFNNYFVDQRFIFNHESSGDVVRYYDEVLESTQVLINNNLTETLIDSINHGSYIMIFCDMYYLENTYQYEKIHSMHEIIIHGYDLENKIFNYIHYNGGKETIGFSGLEESFHSFMNSIEKESWIYYDSFPITALALRSGFDRKVNYKQLLNQVDANLRGDVITFNCQKNLTKKLDNVAYGTKMYGISVYRCYYETLYGILANNDFILSSNRSFILFGIKGLVESKKLLINKFEYLRKNEKKIYLPDELINKTEALHGLLQTTFLLCTKYLRKLDLEVLNRIKNNFMRAEELDTEILMSFRELLQEYVINLLS